MKRGFKSEAEKISVSFRAELKLASSSPLSMRKLAGHLGIMVAKPSKVPGLPENHLQTLCNGSRSGWSALCMKIPTGHLILYNESHSIARQESDLAHEIAHVIRQHKPENFVEVAQGVQLLSGYDKEQEAEAEWLGSCLQLPKDALVNSMFRGLSVSKIAELFGASEAMVNFRLNSSGAKRIVMNSQRQNQHI